MPGRAPGGGGRASLRGLLAANCSGATVACGADATKGTSTELVTAPALTVMVFTRSGWICCGEAGAWLGTTMDVSACCGRGCAWSCGFCSEAPAPGPAPPAVPGAGGGVAGP